MHSDIVLGFDFGTKWIGVAVGNKITRSANPLKQIRVKEGRVDWSVITSIINEWQPGTLVVGLPLKVDGSRFYVTELASAFIDSLNEKYQLPVYAVDERMTTVEARQALFEEHGYKGLNKANIDSMAAKLLTEQWMSEG